MYELFGIWSAVYRLALRECFCGVSRCWSCVDALCVVLEGAAHFGERFVLRRQRTLYDRVRFISQLLKCLYCACLTTDKPSIFSFPYVSGLKTQSSYLHCTYQVCILAVHENQFNRSLS